MDAAREQCCICGRVLPNRWAVAGRCEADGCGAAFCALHWHNGNRLCREHGWKIKEDIKMDEGEDVVGKAEAEMRERAEAEIRERAKTEMSPQARESVVKKVAAFAVTLGKGAASLVDRMRGVKDPEAAIAALDAQLKANRERREPLVSRSESLYAEIVAKKKAFLSAHPARKKILELELRGLIAEYQGLERQLAVYFENERILNTVRGRTLELTAMGLRKISEKEIDKLTDDIEDAAGAAQGAFDAMRDLEKAGKRYDSGDADAFAEALAGFDESFSEVAEHEPVAAEPEAFAGFDEPAPDARKEVGAS